MELSLYRSYSREEAIAALNKSEALPEVLCDGDFVVLPQTTLCFVTVGGSAESHFLSPFRFTWVPQRLDYDPSDEWPWFPEKVRNCWVVGVEPKRRKHYHIFARLLRDEPYIYVGYADLSSYSQSQSEGNSASFSLVENLPREVWLDLGGSLQSKEPLSHLSEVVAEPVSLSYHCQTFGLLRLVPQKSEEDSEWLLGLDKIFGHPFPAALREWYGLHGVFDIMAEISQSHHPNTFDQIQTDEHYMAQYALTASSQFMLPVMFENQGVCHWAVPLDAGDNPPVYVGFQEKVFDWRPHAKSFSEFIWAWTWDYMVLSRDYFMDVSEYFLEEDLVKVSKEFEPGPYTHHTSAIFLYKDFQRFMKGDQRITIMSDETSRKIWFSAESRESMEKLLAESWAGGSILERNSELDIEMQKMFLLW